MGQAVEIARRMKAKNLILTHFSARYSRVCPLPDYLFNDENKNGGGDKNQLNIGVAQDNMIVRFDRLPDLSKILSVYRGIFAETIFEFTVNLFFNLIGLKIILD